MSKKYGVPFWKVTLTWPRPSPPSGTVKMALATRPAGVLTVRVASEPPWPGNAPTRACTVCVPERVVEATGGTVRSFSGYRSMS